MGLSGQDKGEFGDLLFKRYQVSVWKEKFWRQWLANHVNAPNVSQRAMPIDKVKRADSWGFQGSSVFRKSGHNSSPLSSQWWHSGGTGPCCSNTSLDSPLSCTPLWLAWTPVSQRQVMATKKPSLLCLLPSVPACSACRFSQVASPGTSQCSRETSCGCCHLAESPPQMPTSLLLTQPTLEWSLEKEDTV